MLVTKINFAFFYSLNQITGMAYVQGKGKEQIDE